MKAKPFSISKHLPVLFLLVFLSFFAHLGYMPLLATDEGTYSEVTREMLENQDFASIQLNGMPFSHKPPLFYWAQAASVKILGLNEFGLRMPSAIAALLWVASIFLFSRRYYDTRTGWYACLFMGASLLVTLVGRAAAPEALLNLFLTLTLLNIYRFYQSGNRRHIYWAFMFGALGVLTKGAIAIMLPVAASLVFFGIKKRWKDLLRLFFNPVGLMVAGLIVIPWYLGEYMLHGEAFLGELLMLPGIEVQQYNFFGDSLPYYSYLLLLLIGLLPFSALLIKAFSHTGKLLSDDLVKFLLIWFLLAFLFLPLTRPKSILSVAYCTPPLFIIMARAADSIRHPVNIFIWPILCVLLLLPVPYLAPYIAAATRNDFVRSAITEGMAYFDSFYLLTLGALLLLFAVLPFIKPVPFPVKYTVLALLFVSMVNFLVLPIMGNILQQPIKTAGLLAKKDNLDVIKWRIDSPSFNVYAERLTRVRAPQAGDIVLTKSAYLGNDVSYETLFAGRGIILARILDIPAKYFGSGGGDDK